MNMKNKKGSQSLETLINTSDLDWIQTSNLLSRNQVRYSVAPRGLILLQLTCELPFEQLPSGLRKAF